MGILCKIFLQKRDLMKQFNEISSAIDREKIQKFMRTHFNEFAQTWMRHQSERVTGSYQTFGDHEKFLICIHLVKKTLDFYYKNNVKFSMEEFYSRKEIELEKYNVIEISKELKIPKETTRRKIVELEKMGAIKRFKKRIVLDQKVLNTVKPNESIERTAVMLSKLSVLLEKYDILKKNYSSKEILSYLRKNFSYCWRLFYRLQLPVVVNWKTYFGDIEAWHIWATVSMNQAFISEAYTLSIKSRTVKDFPYDMAYTENNRGVSAMAVSDITKIPRATVIRKLSKLIKSKHLIVDKKKHYHLSPEKLHNLTGIFESNIDHAVDYVARTFNQFLFNKEIPDKIKSKKFEDLLNNNLIKSELVN